MTSHPSLSLGIGSFQGLLGEVFLCSGSAVLTAENSICLTASKTRVRERPALFGFCMLPRMSLPSPWRLVGSPGFTLLSLTLIFFPRPEPYVPEESCCLSPTEAVGDKGLPAPPLAALAHCPADSSPSGSCVLSVIQLMPASQRHGLRVWTRERVFLCLFPRARAWVV